MPRFLCKLPRCKIHTIFQPLEIFFVAEIEEVSNKKYLIKIPEFLQLHLFINPMFMKWDSAGWYTCRIL
jgi:hypothetical protein